MQGWRQILSWQEDLPIIWNDREFWGIQDFDCHTIRLRTYKEDPSYGDDPKATNYFCWIPISHKEYRDEQLAAGRRVSSRVVVMRKKAYTVFTIYDDWNVPHVMQIPNYMTDVIQQGIQGARDQGLPVEGV